MLSTLSLIALFISAVNAAGKRGLAWPYYNNPLNPAKFNTGNGKVVAIYDWETYAPPSTSGSGGLTFIGMQGCSDCDSSPISQLASRQAAQNWATVFTLNEPDISEPSISPSDAASWYITHINPLAIKKAFPAVTSSSSSGQGLDWLAQMISACAGKCHADYINLHWYGTSFSDFQSYVQKAHAQFPNYTIVISEFALTNPPGGASAQESFFRQAFSWLDSQNYVTLYFPFVTTSPSLLSSHDKGAIS
ncbi:hypothetical protein IW262DRAFT_132229 [Armillaria fumosa]|nr:hypothetical protein IW262DRAFT_132229 [Armillaria fumosa]